MGKYVNVADVCFSISKTYTDNAAEVVLINTSDVLEGKILNHHKVPNANLRGQFKKTFQKDDILYSEIRPKNKRYAFVDFEPTNYIASTKLMVIRANKALIRPKYLYNCLRDNSLINDLQLLAETRSGTFPQITFTELGSLQIFLPSLKEQDQIIQYLKSQILLPVILIKGVNCKNLILP